MEAGTEVDRAFEESAAPERPTTPVFDTPNVLWHFGALAATAASVAVVTQVHPSARGFWILLVSLVFLAGYGLGAVALLRAGWAVPGGIVASAAITFIPVGGVGLERLVGAWGGPGLPADLPVGAVTSAPPSTSFQGHDLALALATVVAGLLVYALVRYAFAFAWVAVASLIATQLLLPAVDAHPSFSDRADAFGIAGLVFVGIGLYCDLLHARRVAFWWHLVGLWAITFALSYHAGFHTSPGWIVILAAGIAAVVVATMLRRGTWALFGILGSYAPFFHYSATWFGNLGAAFALAVVGFALVGVGLAIQHAGDSWAAALIRRARPA